VKLPKLEKQNDYILSIDCDWVLSPSQHQDLLSYFIDKLQNVEEVYFGEDHHFHYSFVPSNAILVNIDEHHDMGYADWQYNNLNKGIMDEATWVLALIRYKKLKGYIWVSNYESGFREFLETNLAKVRQLPIFKRYFHLKDISTITYSKILVCESFDFSPQSKYVYYSLLAIARAMNKKIIRVDDVPNCRQLLKVNQKLTPER